METQWDDFIYRFHEGYAKKESDYALAEKFFDKIIDLLKKGHMFNSYDEQRITDTGRQFVVSLAREIVYVNDIPNYSNSVYNFILIAMEFLIVALDDSQLSQKEPEYISFVQKCAQRTAGLGMNVLDAFEKVAEYRGENPEYSGAIKKLKSFTLKNVIEAGEDRWKRDKRFNLNDEDIGMLKDVLSFFHLSFK